MKNKSYSFIKIFSLSIGLIAAIAIMLWVQDEMSFDKFHGNANNIYRVMTNNTYPDGRIETYPATSGLLKDAVKNEIPEVDRATLLSMESGALVRFENNSFNEQGLYADSMLFSIFSFPFVEGSSQNPFPGINSIVISERLAKKLFGNANPVGKQIDLDQRLPLIVTGVFANIPNNSTLQFDFALPFEQYIKDNPWTQNWRSGGTQTFVSLKPGASLEEVNRKMEKLIRKNCNDCTTTSFLFPYTSQRLYSEFENGKSSGGRIDQVRLFSIVAAIIMLMACINFMNLATAQSVTRSREIGVRKTIGAKRSGLIMHFIFESLFLAFIGLLIALTSIELLLPFFNEVTGKSLRLNFADAGFVGGLLGITLICGILAGSYPALFLSSFKPVTVLKGNSNSSLSGNGFRKTLVVVQFVTAIILITGSIVIYRQIGFISNKNLGFNKENVIVIQRNENLGKNFTAFKNDLLQLPSVKNIGFGGSDILTVPITTTDPVWLDKPANSAIAFKIFRSDEGLIPALNIPILAGRNFSGVGNRDSANYIVNKTAMRAMGLTPENVIGADLEMWNGKGKIIGLTDDFNNDNLRRGIEPLIFLYSTNVGSNYYISISANTAVSSTLSSIENTFKKYSNAYPFEYSFLDDAFTRQYRTEEVIGKLSLAFTMIAILISCMGLFGLAMYSAVKRTKEIGIRKVVGASSFTIVRLLSGEFLKLVVIAAIIAMPLAYLVMSKWLENFTYRTNISWWIFITVGVIAMFIAIAATGFQAIRAAMANPLKSLRTE